MDAHFYHFACVCSKATWVMVFYKQNGSLRAPMLVFAKRKSVSATPDRPASETADRLHGCSFSSFGSYLLNSHIGHDVLQPWWLTEGTKARLCQEGVCFGSTRQISLTGGKRLV